MGLSPENSKNQNPPFVRQWFLFHLNSSFGSCSLFLLFSFISSAPSFIIFHFFRLFCSSLRFAGRSFAMEEQNKKLRVPNERSANTQNRHRSARGTFKLLNGQNSIHRHTYYYYYHQVNCFFLNLFVCPSMWMAPRAPASALWVSCVHVVHISSLYVSLPLFIHFRFGLFYF